MATHLQPPRFPEIATKDWYQKIRDTINENGL